MSLFQKSVIQKYLNNLDDSVIRDAYKRFQDFYGDKERIENIKLLKEENYQEGFLREIFVDVLGYTINPDKNYNLTTEFKNLTDSGKADGAILQDGNAIGVIELKSTKTTDLESIKKQAFSYKNNQPDCKYVITSNFEKLRFYIDNATEFEEFNLFNLSAERFAIFYLILSKESIFAALPVKLKDESRLHEESVSDKLYKDYSSFKRNVFNNLVKNNPQHEKLFLFHKSQKLLDRLLFVLFAEDRGLIPPNAISKIIDQWKKFAELDEPVSLYSRFVKLFHHLDEGHKYPKYELPAYNGGLFRKDEILDELIIDDDILYKDTLKLSTYDFNTEIDVNILGHIFEHSINEIEELTAELEGKEASRNKSKRKKEGIFYTPKFITKYIVENTVGALCEEKKKELKIDEIEIELIKNSRTAKGKLTKKAEELLKRLETYRNYLVSLKILDPACGSGAFLNQALEFLINEHEMIDSYRKELEQDALGLYDISKSILENNLYGVDINEEAVEIAKLSLWLRTAEKGRKLSDLSTNLKCGNSLIDDPEVARDKAFKWEEEFPQIFSNSHSEPDLSGEESAGFDVVIGNPPYLGGRDWKEEFGRRYDYFSKEFQVAEYQFDIYVLFFERAIKVAKNKGYVSFISPNTWLNNQSCLKLRKHILDNTQIKSIVDYTNIRVFGDVVVLPIISVLVKSKNDKSIIKILKPTEDESIEFTHSIGQEIWKKDKNKIFNLNLTETDLRIRRKIENNTQLLSEIAQIKFGIKLYETGKGDPPQLASFSKDHIYESDIRIDNTYRKYLEGKDIDNYLIKWNNRFIKYGSNLAAPRDASLFEGERILLRRIVGSRLIAAYTNEDFVTSQLLQIVKPKIKEISRYLLALLNSRLMVFYFRKKYNRQDITFPEIRIYELSSLPIKIVDSYDMFNDKANLIIKIKTQLQEKTNTFLSRIQSNFPIEKLSNKLKAFYKYDFKTFLAELKKKKITLTLQQQDEWEPYFNKYKDEINSLQEEINKTDAEIDQMVYRLYGLTDEEIKIVEESTS